MNTNIQNQEFPSPEEMKSKLVKINTSFNNYIKSLIKDFDDNPDNLKDSTKYSNELIDEFKQFYNHFNILSEEALMSEKEVNQNISPHLINSDSRRNGNNQVIIDNQTIKALAEEIKDKNDKLNAFNKENYEKKVIIQKELRSMPIFQKKKK